MAFRFTTRRLFFVTTIVVLVVSWFALRATPIEALFGGRGNVAVVAQPEQVLAYRVGPLPEGIVWQQEAFSDYPIVSEPVELPAAIAKQVSAALASPATYVWETAKACQPNYGAQLSFISGEDRVDVLLCFACDMLLVGRDGQTLGSEDFDHARGVLVRAVKECFPDDEVIQRLSESRR